MGSKFLNSNSTASQIITLLNDGTQTLNVASMTDQGLIPGLPTCTDNNKKLISRQIATTDLNFVPLSSPLTSDFNVGGNNINHISLLRAGTTDTMIGLGTAPGSYNIACDTNANGTNNSIILGSSSCVNIRSNGTFCDLGSTGAPFTNVNAVGNLRGLTNNRAIDDILSNSGSAGAIGNIPTYSSTTGKVLEDSGIALSSLTPMTKMIAVGLLAIDGSGTGGRDLLDPSNIPPTSNIVIPANSFRIGDRLLIYCHAYFSNTDSVGSQSFSFGIPGQEIIHWDTNTDSDTDLIIDYTLTYTSLNQIMIYGKNDGVFHLGVAFDNTIDQTLQCSLGNENFTLTVYDFSIVLQRS